MSKRTKITHDLSYFGNALRNYLGMPPLYQLTANGKHLQRPTDLERFLILPPVPFAHPKRLPGHE